MIKVECLKKTRNITKFWSGKSYTLMNT